MKVLMFIFQKIRKNVNTTYNWLNLFVDPHNNEINTLPNCIIN